MTFRLAVREGLKAQALRLAFRSGYLERESPRRAKAHWQAAKTLAKLVRLLGGL